MKKGQDYTGVTIVFACHDGDGNYLFAKRGPNCRDEHGTWDCGAGALEFGTTIEETLRKEIGEEYTASVLSHEFLGYRDVHREYEGNRTHWLALDFKVHVDTNGVSNGEPHKMEEIGWFKLHTFPELMHSQWDIFFNKYKDKLT